MWWKTSLSPENIQRQNYRIVRVVEGVKERLQRMGDVCTNQFKRSPLRSTELVSSSSKTMEEIIKTMLEKCGGRRVYFQRRSKEGTARLWEQLRESKRYSKEWETSVQKNSNNILLDPGRSSIISLKCFECWFLKLLSFDCLDLTELTKDVSAQAWRCHVSSFPNWNK